jgi:hypothetical protein
MRLRPFTLAASVCCAALVLASCTQRQTERPHPLAGIGGVFGGGGSRAADPNAQVAGIGVNSLLWRASLDTLGFMPLEQVDPYGGVIITDWHANPEVPGERFKATVYILDSRLRGDALSVQLFRQEQGAGGWQDAAVDPATRIQVENAILTRARQLRIAQTERR